MVNLCGQKKECALVYSMKTAALKMSTQNVKKFNKLISEGSKPVH